MEVLESSSSEQPTAAHWPAKPSARHAVTHAELFPQVFAQTSLSESPPDELPGLTSEKSLFAGQAFAFESVHEVAIPKGRMANKTVVLESRIVFRVQE
jgi:hypothetical protein